jgi:hypothetical protein
MLGRVTIALLFAACSGHDATPDAAVPCPIGDPTQPAQLEIMNLDENLQPVMTTSGLRVPLIEPEQGGFVAYFGARATNIDGCRLTITTSYRDLCGPTIISLDKRPSHLDAAGDGWGTMPPLKFGNLPFCPEVGAPHDSHDVPYEVTVTLEDPNGQKASASVVAEPYCLSPDPTGICLCTCDHNYVLGGSCPPAGADAGMTCAPM